jgi:chromosome segregation ATPase
MPHPLQIHELDEELQLLRKQHQDQAQQLELREAEVASLKNQLTTWRAVKDAEAASLSSSNKQLAEQLAREIAHGKTLDKQLAKAQAESVRNVATYKASNFLQQSCLQRQEVSDHARVQRLWTTYSVHIPT